MTRKVERKVRTMEVRRQGVGRKSRNFSRFDRRERALRMISSFVVIVFSDFSVFWFWDSSSCRMVLEISLSTCRFCRISSSLDEDCKG